MNIFQKVTLKTLKENKTRTIVTIIGIILSLSMFTAVTTSISSFQNHLLTVAKIREGNWHVCVPAETDALQSLPEYERIDDASFLEEIGYVKLNDSSNPDKPFLFLGGMDAHAQGILPLLVTDGRLPKTDTELLIPDHLAYNGNVVYQLGDTITMEVGHRISTDENGEEIILWQNTPYLYTEEEQMKMRKSKTEADEDDSDSETEETESSDSTDSDETELSEPESFQTDFTKTYTVVGFYSRPAIENYSAPGYTALTISGENRTSSYMSYIRFKNPEDAVPWLNQNFTDMAGTDTNNDLLRMYAASYESSYNTVLYGLGTILILIILFGSISLIYNAFSISVTERTKQFGLLASLGATKKQLIHSVLFEAFVLCIIGIPLGILAGLAGIGITFSFVGSSMSKILWGDLSISLTLHATPAAILIAAAIGLITVLVSAYLPARRSAKLSPIEAIRMTSDIAIRPGKVRTMRLTYRLFGLSGMLASKNFKRNRRKYRATVLSLFVSVVLFISASSFCSYLLKGAESIISDSGFDIIYRRYEPGIDDAQAEPSSAKEDISNPELLKRLAALKEVTQAAYALTTSCTLEIPRGSLSPEYRTYLEQTAETTDLSESICTTASLLFIDDDSFDAYMNENGIDVANDPFDAQPPATVCDFVRMFDGNSQKYSAFHMLNGTDSNLTFLRILSPDGYRHVGTFTSEDEEPICYFESEDDPDESLLEMPAAACSTPVPLTILSFPEQPPFFLGERYSSGLTLLYPLRAMEALLGPDQMVSASKNDIEYYFKAKDHTQATADISELLTELGLSNNAVYDYAESAAQERSMFTIITIFSYGFIILISLIAIANVFNTISTNIQLRKREFAMLKSTGMTPKGFRVMMCYECLLYGIKSLLFGLPVSLLVTYRIYRSVSAGWTTGFYIPWYSLVIAIGSVFLVVGSTMIYSMHKIGRENIMDHLKNENA